jgi:hypothetical protein
MTIWGRADAEGSQSPCQNGRAAWGRPLKFQVSDEGLLLVRMRWELLQTTYDLVSIQGDIF